MRVKINSGRIKLNGGRLKYSYTPESKNYVDKIQASVSLTAAQRLYAHFMVGVDITNGLWVKRAAYYLYLGGTASTHKWNVKDLRDLDAAFRLTFPNGMTHDDYGITGNGGSYYANTFLDPSSVGIMANTSSHLSVYLTKNVTDNEVRYVIGSGTYSVSPVLSMYIRRATIQGYLCSNPTLMDDRVYTNNISDVRGLYTGNNYSSALRLFRNGRDLDDNSLNRSDGFSAISNLPIYIMAINPSAGGSPYYDNKSLGVSSIGAGFTENEMIIDAKKTIFGQKILNRA